MEVLENYTIRSYGFSINVSIAGVKGRALNYRLNIPEFSEVTLAFLDSIKTKAVTQISLTASEILSNESIGGIKERFHDEVSQLLMNDLPNIDESTKNVLIGRLMNDIVGLGDIEFLLLDDGLEEIVINSSSEPIRVYHKRYGWLTTNVSIEKESQINNYAEIIARRVGRQITSLEPLLDAHLSTGDRANAVLYPISNKGNTITIRKFARDPWTVTDLIKNKTCTSNIFALIWLAIQYEMSIIISGGTASGKCVTGDTPVYLADGSRKKIKELTEEHFGKKQVFSDNGWEFVYAPDLSILTMDPDSLKIKKRAVNKIWRHQAPRFLIKVTTSFDRTITVTPEHPFFLLQQEQLFQCRADGLHPGMNVVVPSFSYLQQSNQTLIANADTQ